MVSAIDLSDLSLSSFLIIFVMIIVQAFVNYLVGSKIQQRTKTGLSDVGKKLEIWPQVLQGVQEQLEVLIKSQSPSLQEKNIKNE